MRGTNYGWVVRYSYTSQLVEANAEYHGYDLAPYKDRCGFATMSPANLGQIGWFRLPSGEWYGPCLAVDVSAMKDFHANVYIRHEVAEAGPSIMSAYGVEFGTRADIHIGLCPPKHSNGIIYARYLPALRLVAEGTEPPFIRFPAQQWPVDCRTRLERLMEQP